MEPDGSWPIVWERAKGVHVWDADGKKYLDLTAAFGVAAAGHANPQVVKAGQKQMAQLLHAMGDVHPHALKARARARVEPDHFRALGEANRAITQSTPSIRENHFLPTPVLRPSKSALKTAMLATGKHGVIAFDGAYHGLGYGALNATHRDFFRRPFQSQLREFGHFVPVSDKSRRPRRRRIPNPPFFPPRTHRRDSGRAGAGARRHQRPAAGISAAAAETVRRTRRAADSRRNLHRLWPHRKMVRLRTHAASMPDLICLGKALTGGFPLSACVGRADLMDAAWPASTGEAIHTSTFLGHPGRLRDGAGANCGN